MEQNNYEQEHVYNQSPQQPNNQLEVPMTLGEWVITMILLGIPCVGLIMAIVWAFAQENVNTNKKNYCRAYLIFIAISVALFIFANIFMTAMIASIMGSIGNSY